MRHTEWFILGLVALVALLASANMTAQLVVKLTDTEPSQDECVCVRMECLP